LNSGINSSHARRDATGDDRVKVSNMCQILRSARQFGNIRLRLLLEGSDGDDLELWQQRSRPRELYFLDSFPAVSLENLLSGGAKLPLVARRRLAVIFANSLLQLSERPWLNERYWNKAHISFFYESADIPNLTRPYLFAQLDGQDPKEGNGGWPDINQFHLCPSVLSLGILLIEIHLGKTIESFRTSRDLTNGVEANANTDWTTADRVAKSLDDCSAGYKAAIQACLGTPWVPAGQRVSLEDSETRRGFIRDVLQPLQQELTFLLNEKM